MLLYYVYVAYHCIYVAFKFIDGLQLRYKCAVAKTRLFVLSFATLRKYRDPSDRSRSLTISLLPQPISSTAQLALFAKKLYIGVTGSRLDDRFREHLRDVEKDDQNASKLVARHFILPNYTKQQMAVCGLSLHQGRTESCKTLEQKSTVTVSTNAFRSTNLIYSVVFHVTRNQPIA